MIFPIRCFSCGLPIGHLWEEFKARVEGGEPKQRVLDEFGLKRYCCRQVFLGHIDLIETVSEFKKY